MFVIYILFYNELLGKVLKTLFTTYNLFKYFLHKMSWRKVMMILVKHTQFLRGRFNRYVRVHKLSDPDPAEYFTCLADPDLCILFIALLNTFSDSVSFSFFQSPIVQCVWGWVCCPCTVRNIFKTCFLMINK